MSKSFLGNSLLTRRRVLALGAGSLLLAAGLRPAKAVLKLDVTQGNVQPMPIALPEFLGGSPNDIEVARNVTGIITNNLRRSGLFAPIDPSAFIERITDADKIPDLRRLARDQCAGAGDRPRRAAGRRPAAHRIPALGRVRRPAAGRTAILHLSRKTGGASVTSSRTRSTSD